MTLPLSIVIITFNEAKNIKRCLDAVKGISNDIVIVDGYSADETAHICQQYDHVNFIQRSWEGYAKTKNFANQQAKNNYILSLDADEVLTDVLKASIIGITSFQGVYSFNRLTNYCGNWIKHSGWYPDRKVRIFPKDVVKWQGDYVHETLKIPEGMKETWLAGDLLHYSYHTKADHYRQIEKYSTLHAQKMLAEGKKYSSFKRYVSPAFKFFKTYVLQLGFLDGYAGFQIASISAKAVKMKYEKLRLESTTNLN